MNKISLLTLFSFPIILYAQQPPGTEIYLLDIIIKKSTVTVSSPQNITNHIGYDNQAFFHPKKPLLYYSSANTDGRTDPAEYNYSTRQTRNITTTLDREYSPTVTPDRDFLSCIIQRDSGAQDLGKYPINGGDPVVLINNLIVGYHAWLNNSTLLLFVLGDTLTLHQYNLATKKDVIIAKNIGRSLHKIPKTAAMSFVLKVSSGDWVIKRFTENGTVNTITSTLPGSEDLTWSMDGKILTSDGERLFFFTPGKTTGWQAIVMPADMPVGKITRLAINSKGNKLAIVVSE